MLTFYSLRLLCQTFMSEIWIRNRQGEWKSLNRLLEHLLNFDVNKKLCSVATLVKPPWSDWRQIDARDRDYFEIFFFEKKTAWKT